MSILQTILIFCTVLLLSIGQILFKLASNDIELNFEKIIPSLLNIKLVIAFVVYSAATILWMIGIKGVPLRLAYPFSALAFFFVPMMAHHILNESIGWNTYVGAVIIALGVFVSVYK